MDLLNKYSQYINGTLSTTEMESFTKEVVKDYFEEEALKTRWNKLLEQEHDVISPTTAAAPTKAKRSWLRRYFAPLSIAASVLFLTMSWLTYQNLMVTGYKKLLLAQLNQPHTENLSRKGSIEEMKLAAIDHYNRQEYEKAANTFEKINQTNQSINWSFYIGLCHLYQQKADLAIEVFQEVLIEPKQYKVEAHWYLSLAYLLKEDLPSAKKHLEIVAVHSLEEEAWKIREAKELLRAIEEE